MGRKPAGRPPKYDPCASRGCPCIAKPIWFYMLTEGQWPYSFESIDKGFGITAASTQRAVKAIIGRGMLEVV